MTAFVHAAQNAIFVLVIFLVSQGVYEQNANHNKLMAACYYLVGIILGGIFLEWVLR